MGETKGRMSKEKAKKQGKTKNQDTNQPGFRPYLHVPRRERGIVLACVYIRKVAPILLAPLFPSFLLFRFQVTLTEKRREKDPTRCGYRQKKFYQQRNYKFFQLFLRLKNLAKKVLANPIPQQEKRVSGH